MRLYYLLVKSGIRKSLIINIVWMSIFSFKTNEPLVLKEWMISLFNCMNNTFYV